MPAPLTVTRRINAPRDLVYRAWTEPEQFRQWFGPHAAAMPVCSLDVRTGGSLRFLHRFEADAIDTWVGGTFLDVVPQERLVFEAHFTDEHGVAIERPGFPRSMQITATFSDDDGGTRVTIQMDGLVIDQGESVGMVEMLERLEALFTTAPADTHAANSTASTADEAPHGARGWIVQPQR